MKWVSAAFSLLLSLVISTGNAAERPNIVLIVADDLGWNDVSFHGSRQIPTPNLDALAYDGILLKNYYVQPICTPTRSALLTGRFPIHTGMQHSVIVSAAPYGLSLNETLMSNYLQQIGYNTHIVGKWHLGFCAEQYTPMSRGFLSHYGYYMGEEDYWVHTAGSAHDWHLGFLAPEYTPMARGFASHFGYYQGCGDYFDHTYGSPTNWHLGFLAPEYTPMARGFASHFGYYQGCGDYFDHTYSNAGPRDPKGWGLDFRNNRTVDKTSFGKYSTELFSGQAEKIIHDHNTNKPLFLYLPHQAVHSGNPFTPTPLEAPWKYQEKFSHIKHHGRRMFAAMVSALDDAVGNVTKALHSRGMLNNTVIVFTTDNGGPAAGFDFNFANNWPLRGLKSTLWEGGTRGAGFIWSPLLANSGYHADQMVHVVDWLPTLLHAAGYDMSNLPDKIDGIDQWSVLSEKSQALRTEFLYNIDPKEPTSAIRMNNMKLIFGRGSTKSYNGWYKPEQVSLITPQEFSANDTAAVQSEDTSEDIVDQYNLLAVDTDTALKSPVSSQPEPEHAPAHMFRSDLTDILKSLGRYPVKDSPFQVTCSDPPANYTHNCEVSKKPCLFDIEADPCEFNNLADKQPEVVEHLMARIKAYHKTMVAPRNKKVDPKGLPYYHNGIWEPWLKLEEIPGQI